MGKDPKRRSRREWVDWFRRKEEDPELSRVFDLLMKKGRARIEDLEKGDIVDPKKLHERVTL